MANRIPESDWKVFRELREVALQRFCSRIFETLDRMRQNESGTYHERYIELYGWLHDRNGEMAEAFDDLRRSTMLLRLSVIDSLGLLEPEELERFTPGTREAVDSLTQNRGK